MTAEICESLGIEWMDDEHRELARLIDEFARCIKGGEIDRANVVVGEAITCANAHFEHEEEVAAQANYPKIDDEKFEHRNLRLQFTTLVGDIKSRDAIALEHLIAMRKLLEEHIAGPDRQLADFLKAGGSR